MSLANYQASNNPHDWPIASTCVILGNLIGRYWNPSGGAIGIFAEGVAWFENGQEITLKFSEITEVMLPADKESKGLLFKTKDGRLLHMPVMGQRGRFFDSMEMLRFFDRVISDISCSP